MIRWGIIGFGRMGRQYVDCFKIKSDLFKLSGISSKTSSNIKELNFYNCYEDLIKVKEIDAMGGIMARAIDEAGIQFRILNQSKGPAVRATRAQADRVIYKATIRRTLENQTHLWL